MKAKRSSRVIKVVKGELVLLPAVRESNGAVWVLVKYPRKRKRRG